MRLSIQYYDLVLLGILSSLLLGAGLGYVTPLSTAVTVPAAAVIGAALMYHTIFRQGRVDRVEELAEEAVEVELGK